MMDLFVNTDELTALMDLPLIQRVAYLMGIRPYMDRQTCIVGIKRKISYQSLREVLYVAPIPGVKTEYPSQQQVRRAVKSLERTGLVAIQSTEKNLILKCLLAAVENTFVQNKADMRPTPEAATGQACYINVNTSKYHDSCKQADISKPIQADTPLIKNNNYIIFLLPQFEKFWDLYPLKKSKQKAWEAYQAINPNDELVARITSALQQQIQFHQQQQILGQWIAAWKYPANWLTQHCWEDEIQTDLPQEKNHAVHETHHAKKQTSRDPLWDSYKAGLESESEFDAEADDNIIDLRDYQRKSQTY